jgi:hypothetical protein
MANKAGTCKFKHVVNDVVNDALVNMMGALVVSIDCKYGEKCFTKDCFYKHPVEWDHRKNTRCKFGVKCKNKDTTCEFNHVKIDKKAIDAAGGGTDGMEIDVKKIEKKAVAKPQKKDDSKPKKNVMASAADKVGAGGLADAVAGGGMVIDVNIGEKIKLAVHRKKKTETEQMVV